MSVTWTPAAEFEDIRYETSGDGIAKITINRPEVRNAFRPQTIVEISQALERAREDADVGVIVLTGEGPLAFCSGGDQRVRGDQGYVQQSTGVGRFPDHEEWLLQHAEPKDPTPRLGFYDGLHGVAHVLARLDHPHAASKLNCPLPDVFGLGVMISTFERTRSGQSLMFFGLPLRTTKTMVE